MSKYFWRAEIVGQPNYWHEAESSSLNVAKGECAKFYRRHTLDRREVLAIKDDDGQLVEISEKIRGGCWRALLSSSAVGQAPAGKRPLENRHGRPSTPGCKRKRASDALQQAIRYESLPPTILLLKR